MTDFMHRIAGGWLLAAIAAFAMTLGGLFAFRALPVDAFPDVTDLESLGAEVSRVLSPYNFTVWGKRDGEARWLSTA